MKKKITESAYGPEDYATSEAVERLRALGQHDQAHLIEQEFGEDLGSIDGMDPMEILIALEEHSETA